jgi:hypothetical protein
MATISVQLLHYVANKREQPTLIPFHWDIYVFVQENIYLINNKKRKSLHYLININIYSSNDFQNKQIKL